MEADIKIQMNLKELADSKAKEAHYQIAALKKQLEKSENIWKVANAYEELSKEMGPKQEVLENLKADFARLQRELERNSKILLEREQLLQRKSDELKYCRENMKKLELKLEERAVHFKRAGALWTALCPKLGKSSESEQMAQLLSEKGQGIVKAGLSKGSDEAIIEEIFTSQVNHLQKEI